MNLLEFQDERYRDELRERGWTVTRTAAGWMYLRPSDGVTLVEEEAFKWLLQERRKEEAR